MSKVKNVVNVEIGINARTSEQVFESTIPRWLKKFSDEVTFDTIFNAVNYLNSSGGWVEIYPGFFIETIEEAQNRAEYNNDYGMIVEIINSNADFVATNKGGDVFFFNTAGEFYREFL